MQLIGFLIFSILLIMVSILGTATYLVNRIHKADQRRVQALHRVEYANKLASIGRLASGVAHEINNPLAIINQKVGLIKDLFTLRPGYAADEKLMRLVDDVLESIVRCSSVTRRLLDFSRHMASRIEPVNIEAILRQIMGFMDKEIERRRIRVTMEFARDIPEFMGDRGNLQQIFLNLINNAFAAMTDGGQLDILVAYRQGDPIEVTVSDNGHGIPEEDIKRIFEPFFSTRAQNVGTGLGLSITYGLVTEMGGHISVESRVGQGTRFTVTVPVKHTGDRRDTHTDAHKTDTP
jgi:signal transduction histidine kinase